MAWDTEATRRRLKEAAVTEFAEHGPDGTTMARIAERAGINKERLYKYFGDKQQLFATVLTEELDKLAAGVALHAVGLHDIGEFAARTYDYHADHPHLSRLLQWEGIQAGFIADEAARTKHYREKVEAVREAQRRGLLDPDLDPAYLMFLLIALAAWWHGLPQLAFMLTGADPDAPDERARRRAFVAQAAERLAAPRASHRSDLA
ncbi:TetR family transcriptional regulator [Actinoplanes sp. RD1]|uniref:TetR family transcriptional regulator n=1 Tax=Actinoplanes sp. RD1 TaxID=3064538 RepID=UPI002741A7F7|nr:TetR family transcriptional regulator [Actinoplanes sp. RD1]